MERWILALVLAGCGGDPVCDANQPCSSGAHYNFCNGGSDGCYYAASDGSRFACHSCGDCANALSAAQSWCQSAPAPGDDNLASGSCSADTVCARGSYRLCTDVRGGCYYSLSGGNRIDCASCRDCVAAAQQVASWCDPNVDDGVCAGSNQTACTHCCGQHHSAGAQQSLDLAKLCYCDGCPACADAPVCGGMSNTVSSQCSTCLASAASKACFAEAERKCTADPACNAYQLCALGQCNVR